MLRHSDHVAKPVVDYTNRTMAKYGSGLYSVAPKRTREDARTRSAVQLQSGSQSIQHDQLIESSDHKEVAECTPARASLRSTRSTPAAPPRSGRRSSLTGRITTNQQNPLPLVEPMPQRAQRRATLSTTSRIVDEHNGGRKHRPAQRRAISEPSLENSTHRSHFISHSTLSSRRRMPAGERGPTRNHRTKTNDNDQMAFSVASDSSQSRSLGKQLGATTIFRQSNLQMESSRGSTLQPSSDSRSCSKHNANNNYSSSQRRCVLAADTIAALLASER